MGTYYFAVVPEYKLLVRLDGSGYNENSYRDDINEWKKLNLEDIFNDMCEALEGAETPVKDLSAKDLAKLISALDTYTKFMGTIAYHTTPFAVHTLFGDKVTEILVEYDEKIDGLKKQGYTTVDW